VLLGVATHGDWFQSHSWFVGWSTSPRVIDGLSGGNISTAQAYISDVTTGEERTKGMGVLGAAFRHRLRDRGQRWAVCSDITTPSYPAFAAALCSAHRSDAKRGFACPSRKCTRIPKPKTGCTQVVFLPIIRTPTALLQMLLIFFLQHDGVRDDGIDFLQFT